MKFTGELKFPEIDHPGVPVQFMIEGTQAELLVEGESLGRWSLYDLRARRLVASAFQIDLDGTEVTFVADDPIDFAYRGVEHMAETWATLKSKRIASRGIAVRKSRKGTTPSRIEDMKAAMLANLEGQSAPRQLAGEVVMPGSVATREVEVDDPDWDLRRSGSIPVVGEDPSPVEEAVAEDAAAHWERQLQEQLEWIEDEKRRLTAEWERLEEERRLAERREENRLEAYRLEMERLRAEREQLAQLAGTETTVPPIDELIPEDEPVAVEESVVKGPVEEEPVAVEESVVKGPVEEEPVAVEEPVMEGPVEEEPVAVEGPVEEEPVVEEPVVEEPVVEEPVAEEPVEEEPAEEEPVAVEEPAVEEPAEEEPVAVEELVAVEEPVVDEPVAVEPVAVEPVAVEPEPAAGLVDLNDLEDEPDHEPDRDREPVAAAPAPAAASASTTRERSGLMGAVRAAFRSGSRDHAHQFIEAPGGIGITRYVCEECGYVSISA